MPYGLLLAAGGIDAVRTNAGSAAGLNIHRGTVTNRAVGEALGIAVTEFA